MGIFEYKTDLSKNIYLTVTGIVLGVMWILIFIVNHSPSVNLFLYCLETGIITILIVMIIKNVLKRLDEYQKTLEYYDKALLIDPKDSIALNNKGVQLFHY